MDIFKTSDAIELMPRLEPSKVRRLLRVAYEHWSSSGDYIDPHPDRQRNVDKLGLLQSDDLAAYMHSRERNVALYDLSDLIATPRALKRLLYDVDRAWERLRGEAELDDVIIVNALRHSSESVIDFLVRHIDVARTEPVRGMGSLPAEEDKIAPMWRAFLDTLENPQAVQSLVDQLGIRRLTVEGFVFGQRSPQDVRNYSPTDYFRRILTGELGPSEVRDQTVLRDTRDWIASLSDRMIVSLVASSETNDRYAQVWEYLGAKQLAVTDLLRAASEINVRLLRREGPSVIFQKSAGAIGVWRELGQRHTYEWADWLTHEIRRALTTSLLFASDLFYWYGSVRYGIVGMEGRQSVRSVMVEEARTIYRDPTALLSVLSLDEPYAITRFVRPPVHEEPPDTVTLSNLKWFADLLVDASHLAPELIIPDVLSAFGEFGHRIERTDVPSLARTYTLNRTAFAEFFADRTDEMLNVVASFSVDERTPTDALEQIRTWQAERRSED